MSGTVRADFHVHSCLSPCGSLEMSPSAIAARAAACGLSLVALTDHNSALNAPAWRDACARVPGLMPLYGMELCTVEEVHSLCLFDSVAAALDFGEYIYSLLPPIRNNPDRFGDQVYVDADENILGEVELYLGAAADLSFERAMDEVHARGGLFIPAHIDREMYGVLNQLGFLPEGRYDALEISRHAVRRNAIPATPDGIPLVTGSDAHYLDDLGVAVNLLGGGSSGVTDLLQALREEVKFEISG